MPGIFAQTVVFAAATTAIGMTDDVSKGIIDRFRSLPMARSAVLIGRAVSDLVYNAGILVVLMLSGLPSAGASTPASLEFFAGVGLLLLFTFAMSWVGVWLGLTVPTVEVGQQVGFTVIFPLTFLSNVFVPPETLPSWLQPIAEWNPVSALTASLRELWGNPNPYAADGFPAEHPVLLTLIWVVVILAVFAPLGVAALPLDEPLRPRRMSRPFRQVDVFSTTPYRGNPVAVVLEADGLTTEAMQVRAMDEPLRNDVRPAADRPGSRLRGADLHAGRRAALRRASDPRHVSCVALDGGRPQGDVIVQECKAGLVPIRRTAMGSRSRHLRSSGPGPVEEELLDRIASVLGIDRAGSSIRSGSTTDRAGSPSC